MDYSIPRQQPAVVLRAHFNWLRALLAIALICVGGLTATVGIVATVAPITRRALSGAPPAKLSNGSDNGLPAARSPRSSRRATTRARTARSPRGSQDPYPEATQGPLPRSCPSFRQPHEVVGGAVKSGSAAPCGRRSPFLPA